MKRRILGLVVIAVCFLLASCSRPKDPPQAAMGEIDSLMKAQHYRRAADLAGENLKRYPQSARLRLLLGRAEFFYGNFDAVLKALLPAIGEGWGGEEINGLVGSSYYHLGDFESARRHLQEIVSVGSDNREILKQYGYVNYYLSDGKTALQVFNRLKESLPSDLESYLAYDALLSLTGKWPAGQMVWVTEPMIGAQICYPGGWVMERKERLSPAGKTLSVRFQGKSFGEEGRFLPGGVMLLSAHENASKHPLPQFLRGSFRRGEETDEGVAYYPTQPGAQPTFASLPRDPSEIARYLSSSVLRSVSEQWGFSIRDFSFLPESGIRGKARYCMGEIVAQDEHGWEIVGRSLGVYDSSTDTFWTLLLYGSYANQAEVRALSKAIFHLTLFGGVTGIPPAPERVVLPEEYEARIQGFLQAGQVNRALVEAQNAVKIYPAAGSLHALRGEAEELLWHPREAANAYEEAHRQGYSTYRSESALGYLWLGLGDLEASRQAFERALGFKPSDPSAWSGLGLTAYWKGDISAALGHFQKAVDGMPAVDWPRYLLEAMKALLPDQSSLLVYWFEEKPGEMLFCVPVGWAHRMPDPNGNPHRVLFSPGVSGDKGPESELTYARYESASYRTGRISNSAKPEELMDAFLRQAYDQIEDPQKLWQQFSPIFEREGNYYALGGFSYTQQGRRMVARVFTCYQPRMDRLHALLFQTEARQFETWEPWLQACFKTARFK